MHRFVLGLGTNIGNCIENLRRAVAELAEIITITAVDTTGIRKLEDMIISPPLQ